MLPFYIRKRGRLAPYVDQGNHVAVMLGQGIHDAVLLRKRGLLAPYIDTPTRSARSIVLQQFTVHSSQFFQ